MATTENTYTGDGSTTLFPFTFEYINNQDVKVQLDGTDTTEYSLANATTVSMNTAPASGVEVRVYRLTDTASVPATFYSGSTIQASDLNENFNQTLFVSQEVSRDAALASDAYPVAAEARATANAAETTADNAAADAATAISTANGAVTTANGAVTTANTAEANSNIAVSTAEAASAAVSSVVTYTLVANVAAIPASPSDGDRVEVSDSTGIESFTPLTGVPVGYVGDAGKAARISYSLSGTTWQWIGYIVNDPEGRYAQISGQSFTGTVVAPDFTGTLTGNVTGDVTGNVTGDLTGNVTGDTNGTHTGPVTGDVTGNLIGNANTATNATQAANSALLENLNSSQFLRSDQSDTSTGTITAAGFVGDVTGNASTVSVGGTFGTSSKRPIACWGTASDGGGATNSNIKSPIDGPGTATIRGDGYIFSTGLSTGGVSINSSIISSGLGSSLANLGQGVVGATMFAGTKTKNSAKTFGSTISGSNLRPVASDSSNSGSGTQSGTWRCQGYSAANTGTNYNTKSATCWIRIA